MKCLALGHSPSVVFATTLDGQPARVYRCRRCGALDTIADAPSRSAYDALIDGVTRLLERW